MIDPLQLRTVLATYYSDKDWRFSETAISYEELEWFEGTPIKIEVELKQIAVPTIKRPK
jgi:hypothetical protein